MPLALVATPGSIPWLSKKGIGELPKRAQPCWSATTKMLVREGLQTAVAVQAIKAPVSVLRADISPEITSASFTL